MIVYLVSVKILPYLGGETIGSIHRLYRWSITALSDIRYIFKIVDVSDSKRSIQ